MKSPTLSRVFLSVNCTYFSSIDISVTNLHDNEALLHSVCSLVVLYFPLLVRVYLFLIL